MSHNDQGLVDLLEIYHARQVRDLLLAQLRRLNEDDPENPLHDEARRRDTRSYYEAMLITAAELLSGLGDELPLS